MAILYILLGLYITFSNLNQLPEIFSDIFNQAFDFKAIAGGFAGSCVMHGINVGFFLTKLEWDPHRTLEQPQMFLIL